MLELKEFIALCKQYCPEWENYEDWGDGEYWVYFKKSSEYALCMYQYAEKKIFMPYEIMYEDGDFTVITDKGISPAVWEDQIEINAEDKDAKDKVIEILTKLHQYYKQIQHELKLNKIKEDF